MKLYVSRELAREVMSGAPAALAAKELGLKEDAASGAFAVWEFIREGDDFILFDNNVPEHEHRIALPGIPTRVSVIIAGDPATARNLLTVWMMNGARPDFPVIVASDAAAAFRGVAETMSLQLVEASQDYVRLNRSLVTIRTELEETRSAMSRLVGLLSTKPSSAAKLVLETTPAPRGLAVALKPGKWVRQKLGLPVDGVSAVGLHLSRVAVGANSALHVRLLAMESNEIVGAWRPKGEVLKAGWLVLELPLPIARLRQSACLEIGFEDSDGQRLSLSLDQQLASDEMGYSDSTGIISKSALALRIWTAPFGSRFIAPRHWLWDEVGVALPLEGLLFRLGAEDWRNIRQVTGKTKLVEVAGFARPIILLDDERECIVTLSLANIAVMDAVQVTLTVASGALKFLRAEIWMTSDTRPVQNANDAARSLKTAKRSGPREFIPDTDQVIISMRLPATLRENRQLIVRVTKESDDRNPCLIELSEIVLVSRSFAEKSGVESTEAVDEFEAELSADAAQADVDDERLPLIAAFGALSANAGEEDRKLEASFEEMRLLAFDEIEVDHLFEMSGYAHVEVTVRNLSRGPVLLPAVRFKMCISIDAASLEFRRGADWPDVFGADVTFQADEHGDVLRLTPELITQWLQDHRGSQIDLRLRAILTNLPGIAGLSALRVEMAPTLRERWLAGLTGLAKLADN